MESLLIWLAAQPQYAIYGVIALLAIIENIFPPFPADTGIAVGAFLAHRGITSPWLVLAVVLVANTAGAMGIYYLAARHSQLLFESRLARRYLSEHAFIRVRREYDRFGTVGLFVARLLPGVRAVVPPFAGLIRLGASRVVAVVSVAGLLWYGAIVFVAAALGENVDRVLAFVGGLNRVAGVIALAAIGGLAWWAIRRRRADRDG